MESVMSEIAGAASPVNTSGTIQQFVIKTCIVAVVISACTIFVSDWLIQDVKEFAGASSRRPGVLGEA